MNEFYTVKPIDNSRLRRPAAPRHVREMARLMAMGAVMAAVALLYAWLHFQHIEVGYQIESLEAERAQAAELNQALKVEAAGLRAPSRIDQIARRQLGLDVPAPGQVTPFEMPGEAVWAELRAAAAARGR